MFNALKDMKQKDTEWMCGTRGVGLVMSDSLMFQRGGPNASDDDFGHIYGMALPLPQARHPRPAGPAGERRPEGLPRRH